MKLEKTDKPAELQHTTIPCRQCGADAEWVNFTEWNDPRTLDYCELDENPTILHLADRGDDPDVMFDIYKCNACLAYTANLNDLVWMDDATGNYYRWQDVDDIVRSPDEQKLPGF